MKRPHFLYHEPDFDAPQTYRFHWPLVVGLSVAAAVVLGALFLLYVACGGLR